jgi:hypothetical protein
MNLADSIGVFLGIVFTIIIFSYLFGDNVLFRLAIHIFIGVSSAIVVIVVFYNVIIPQMILPVIGGIRNEQYIFLFPLFLSVLVVLKAFPKVSFLGDPVIAFLVGIGAATAVGGAVNGTIIPQVMASINIFDDQFMIQGDGFLWKGIFNGAVFLIGLVSTLAFFHFGAKKQDNLQNQRAGWIERVASLGKVYIGITYGVLFAGVIIASLTALIERTTAVIEPIRWLLNQILLLL